MPDSASLHPPADQPAAVTVTGGSTMREVLEAYPGAQRALFRRYHIGGCSSCAFSPDETLEALCRRNNNLDVAEVLEQIRQSHEEDRKILLEPKELESWRNEGRPYRLVDIRTREEWEATRIDGAVLLSQPVMQEILGKWPRNTPLVIYDHLGRSALDAAAFFLGHGFTEVRCLRGGIDAWAQQVDPKVRRYRLERPAT